LRHSPTLFIPKTSKDMKRKALIVGVLIAVFSIGMIADADAHRRGHRHRHGHRYRPHRVWVAPPPPPVVVITPGYGHRVRPYHARPYRHHGYRYNRGYGYNGRGKGNYKGADGYDRRGNSHRRW